MNKLLKTLIFNNELSLAVMDTTELVNRAMKIHHLTPLTSATLGRTLTACVFMSSNLKNEKDKLYVTIAGNGVGGKITVCGNGKLEMRGSIANPSANLPLRADGKLDVGGCVGKDGRLTVVRSMGLKEPYSGSSKLVSGEIAEDFTSYYALSEQQPTAMALGVKIGKNGKCVGAGGVVIQTLPFASNESIEKAEKIVGSMSNISTLIEEKGAENIIKEYFGVEEYQEYHPVYKCLCSKRYIEKLLISFGKEEVYNIINEIGKVEISCEFCQKTYVYTKEDVDKLFHGRKDN